MKKRRMSSIVTALMLVLSLFAAVPEGAFETEALLGYDLYIAGRKVMDTNCSDILGNGEASYDSQTNILTLNKSITCSTYAVKSSISDLIIIVNGSVTLHTGASAMYLEGNTTITGGRLTINAENAGSSGILFKKGNLALYDTYLDVLSGWGIIGDNGCDKLTVNDSTVCLYGRAMAVSQFSYGIKLYNCKFLAPAGAVVDDGTIYESDGKTPAKSVIIVKDGQQLDRYDLHIAGKQVTNLNAKDILGDGEASYDPQTRILELDGDIKVNNPNCIVSGIVGLTVKVNRDVTLTSEAYSAFTCTGETTITGPGKLSLITESSNAAVYVNNCTLWIKDANVFASGSIGFSGRMSSDALVIRNSDVEAEGKSFAIGNFGNGIDLGECYVTAPEKYKKLDLGGGSVHAFSICGEDGSRAAKVRIERPYDLWVCGVQVTAGNQDNILGDTSVWFDRDLKYMWIELPGFSKEADIGIRNGNCEGLTVIVNEDAEFTVSDAGIETDVDMTVTGGCLTITGDGTSDGIRVNNGAALTVTEAEVVILGVKHAIAGSEGSSLVISKSQLDLNAEEGAGAYAVSGFTGGISLTDCYVKTPSDAAAKDGSICTGTETALNVLIVKGEDFIPGDVNKDGKINMRDYAILQKYLLDPTKIEISLAAADLSGDGKVNMRDYALLQKLLLKQK
ncbi:MAG: dockerin type I repeat-containing protein [Ruminococcus sp.]|nr:dockerin type I repeat-containing protein [Ruminococcus sp.]